MTFNETFQLLKEWIENNDKYPSKKSGNGLEKRLSKWIEHKKYNYNKNKLLDNEIDMLQSLEGWRWSIKKDMTLKSTDDIITELTEWIKINNKMPSQESKNNIEKRLGIWCQYKRNAYKKDKLSDEIKDKLTKIDKWFWPKDKTIIKIKTFDESLEEYKKWITENGRIPKRTTDNKQEIYLYNWKYKQAINYKNNEISKNKNKLEQEFGKDILDNIIIQNKKPFEEIYNSVKEWIDTYKCLPKDKSKNEQESKL